MRSERLLREAQAIAGVYHSGQVDKAGEPYFNHLQRVADRVVETVDEMIVAYLHDILEDTRVSEAGLRNVFPDHIVDAVVAITHRKHEPRVDYYQRVKANELARRVKLADVADNSDPARLALLDEETRARLERKYAEARAALEET